MSQNSIPTCYFPSTVLFIDNSHDFLLNFVLQLDETIAYRMFDNSKQALQYIHNKHRELDSLTHLRLDEYTEAKNCPVTNHTINLDLTAIHAEVYNSQRFSEISVVVVDYAGSILDGLEFCSHIENINLKIILLTDNENEKLALAAFHQGLIHQYVNKAEADASELITQSICTLQLQYFQEMSDMIIRMLPVKPPSCLTDEIFIQFFNKLKKEQGIIEYYMVDSSGSFFMLDDDANPSFLIVKQQNDMRIYLDLAREHEANPEILNALEKGEKIPGFWQTKLPGFHWIDWSQTLVPAKQIMSEEIYFYAWLKGNVLFDICPHKIVSYHQYLEQLDAEELLS